MNIIETDYWCLMLPPEWSAEQEDDVIRILALAKEETGKGKPIAIIMKTLMGKGVDFMENDHGWHGIAPNAEQLEDALTQLEETLGDY